MKMSFGKYLKFDLFNFLFNLNEQSKFSPGGKHR
jgi:hypothetical protein